MRERLFLFLLILGFGILLVRLFTLQILQGEYYRELAEGNRIKTTRVPALRGVVYGRNGELLVRNTPEGREYLDGPALAPVLGYIGEISAEELEACAKGARDRSSKSLLRDTNLQGIHNLTGPNANIFSEDRFAPSKNNCPYAAGDIIGKMGIEKSYNLTLRGTDGGIMEEVDADGKKVRKLGERKPVEGKNLRLTIDLDLQKRIFEVLSKQKKAAAVATNPKTGEVLALVSIPSFDPNLFTINNPSAEFIPSKVEGLRASQQSTISNQLNEVLNNPDQPMFNRAIGGQYPPGSVFKIVTGVAGLQEGKINNQTKVEDTGQITVGRWTFGNWYYKQYGKTEGWLDIVGAFKRSNDIFFYRVGEWLGIDKLSVWAKRFGLGKIAGIDLPGEEAGLVPTKEWKKESKNEDWFLGDDFITAIGQGDLLTTPLQVNLMTSVIANGGSLCRPKIVQSSKFKVQSCEGLKIKKENLDLVKEGMKEACQTGGTAWPFFKFKIQNAKIKIDDENYFPQEASDSADTVYVPVACKTGTAEAPGKESKAHAWFTVFAPIADPEIVLTVLVENGGEGSSVAGPIAKEILKWWFEKEK